MRSIYGVDLNPMAVELAKVSLWLDAFAIGAPLSFLDHHLRCGNSLVGATFEDLDAATNGKRFRNDYEPLRRVIRRVIEVNQWSDTTPVDGKQSTNEHRQARDDLSGYRIALDSLVAQHWGQPNAANLLSRDTNIDLSSRDRFLASLANPDASSLVAQVESLARQADQRFFHWEIEFPEVFFQFAGADERTTTHHHETIRGSSGYDAIIGNPPYSGVRTGRFSDEFVAYATQNFRAAQRNWDISVLFMEQSMRLLARRSALGMIVPSRVATNRDFARFRRDIFESGGPAHVIECGAAFEDPSVLASMIIFQRPPTAGNVRIGSAVNAWPPSIRQLPAKELKSLPDSPFISSLGEQELAIFRDLSASPTRLGNIATITRGMECGKNDPHIVEVTAPNTKPVLSGEGVREFAIQPQGLFMPANLEPFAKYKPDLFRSTPRILVRFVAPYPIAALDEVGYLNFNTVYNLRLRQAEPDGYAWLVAMLNSGVLRWWFLHAFNTHETLFPHVQKYQLERIPLPSLVPECGYFQRLATIGRRAVSGKSIDRPELDRIAQASYGLPTDTLLLRPRNSNGLK
jgi:hypothetical protein